MSLELVTIEETLKPELLQKRAEDLQFPLTDAMRKLVDEMIQKFLEIKAAGLAACQVGYSVRMIVFHVTQNDLKIRLKAEKEIPITVLINPEYRPIEAEGKFEDWEGCFSVQRVMGKVSRYCRIHYWGFTPEGERVEGMAEGYLARLLQHEIDHVNGTLITDVLRPECVQGSYAEMIPLLDKERAEYQRACGIG